MSEKESGSANKLEKRSRSPPSGDANEKRVKASRISDLTPQVMSRWDLPRRPPTLSLRGSSAGSNWDRSERLEKIAAMSAGQTLANSEIAPPTVTEAAGPAATGLGGLAERNVAWTDAALDAVLPSTGFEIVRPPADYRPTRVTRAFGDAAVPEQKVSSEGRIWTLPALREADVAWFGDLVGAESTTRAEARERRALALLLQVKNGSPALRKQALRDLSERARDFGADLLLGRLLPLVTAFADDPWDRHLLVKALTRVLFRLEELARPHAARVLAVAEPMLLAPDPVTRAEGRELVANLAKSVGLPAFVAAVRPVIESPDEPRRAAAARAVAVTAAALGVRAALPFLSALCGARRLELARLAGARALRHLSLFLAAGTAPHAAKIAALLQPLLADDAARVRLAAAAAVTALCDALRPFGGDVVEPLLPGLWRGLNAGGGKGLAVFLRALGAAQPLLSAEAATAHAERLAALLRDESGGGEELRRAATDVLAAVCLSQALPAARVPPLVTAFFERLWTRRAAADRAAAVGLEAAGAALAERAGLAEVLPGLAARLRDEQPASRNLAAKVWRAGVARAGVDDLDAAEAAQAVDALLSALQLSAGEDGDDRQEDGGPAMTALAKTLAALGARASPLLPGLAADALIKLKTRAPRARQLAALTLGALLPLLGSCRAQRLAAAVVPALVEGLGEEFPQVLAATLAALRAAGPLRPPGMLPLLTPLLRNRHEAVQLELAELVRALAEAEDSASPKEWVRVSFDLLDLLRAPRKRVRAAAVSAFAAIARCIGPQDVAVTLINNLKVQDRQQKVCTTIALALVAHACGPFTVLPALMNEYRVPVLAVQTGVLKSIAFMFEFVGETSRDYTFALTPLLEDALTDRDPVKRTTATVALRHLAAGVAGLGLEDCLIHLLNFAFAGLLEQSPQTVTAVVEAFEAMRLSIGPGQLSRYVFQGLFHPARRVRALYWRLYNTIYVGNADGLTPFYPSLNPASQPHQYHETLYYNI